MQPTVLIVDDDLGLRAVVREVLEQAGFAVSASSSGEEAQRQLKEDLFDVAMVDLGLQEMDGFTLLEWLQTHACHVVPVVLSGSNRVEDAVKAVRHGAYDFVLKPIESSEQLVRRIRRAANHSRLLKSHDHLLEEVQRKNIELENRLGQLELAHQLLQSQAVALQMDLNRARAMQQNLLPKDAPFPEHVSLSTVFRPAGKVGGDLYDWFPLNEHRLALYIADTSGHGVSAAMLTVFLKHAVRSVHLGDHRTQASPGEVLAALNQMVLGEALGLAIFISMAYLVIDTRTRNVSFSSAGHPPVLVRRRGGDVESFQVRAPALGINPKVKYEVHSFSLEAGDAVVLYTDGVTDARNSEGDFYGAERLHKAVACADPHADDIVAAIECHADAFADASRFDDDLTVVALGVEPRKAPVKRAPVPEAQPAEYQPESGDKVMAACHDGRLFISIQGSGSWKESERISQLCRQARESRERSVILDLSQCTHLDSTFWGTLHTIATGFEDCDDCRFEIQSAPQPLLREVSELGLTNVLMHFRPEPAPLPDCMHPIKTKPPSRARMGHILLHAHEALVDADPRNADRFASLLKVLHEQAAGARSEKTD